MGGGLVGLAKNRTCLIFHDSVPKGPNKRMSHMLPPPSRIWENFFLKFTQKKQKCTVFFAFLGFYPPIWDNFFWDMSFFYSILTSFSLPTVCLDKRLKSPQNSNLVCGRFRVPAIIFTVPHGNISAALVPQPLQRHIHKT